MSSPSGGRWAVVVGGGRGRWSVGGGRGRESVVVVGGLGVRVLQDLGAGVRARGGVPEGLQRIPGLVVQLLRDLHVDGDEHVAARAVLAPDTLAANTECAAVRGVRRDAQA